MLDSLKLKAQQILSDDFPAGQAVIKKRGRSIKLDEEWIDLVG